MDRKERNNPLWYGHFDIGPLNARVSPGDSEWTYFEALPLSYLFTRRVNSPC